MPTLAVSSQSVIVVAVLTAAIYDWRFRRIPNWLTLSALIVGFGLNTFLHGGQGALSAAEGLLLAFGIYFPLYLLRGMGAGDVKLMAALGTLVGPGNWLEIFLVTSLLGGVVAGVYAFLKRRFAETCCNVYFMLHDLAQLRSPHERNPQLDFRNPGSLGMPHGVLIALSVLLFLLLLYLRIDLARSF